MYIFIRKILAILLILFTVYIFSYLTYFLVGWWCLILGPIISLLAMRPHDFDGKWLWEHIYKFW